MKIRHLVSSLLLAASFALPSAHAGEQLTLGFTKISFSHPSNGQALPFDLEFMVNADASVEGVLRSPLASDITLKRGTFYPAPLPQTTLELSYQARGTQNPLGDLIVEAIHDSGGGAHVRVFDGLSVQQSPSQNVGFRVDRVDLSEGLVLSFASSAGAPLSGSPAALFNRPLPGQPLIARLPIPARGGTGTLTLYVGNGTSGTLIPVKIKHKV